MSFEHEREVRVLFWEVPTAATMAGEAEFSEHRTLPVNLEVLLDMILLSPSSPSWLLSDTQELLRHFDLPETRVQRSNLYDITQ